MWDARVPRVELRGPGHAGTLSPRVEAIPSGGNNQFVFRGGGVAWGRDPARLVTAAADGTVRMWDPATGRELSVVWKHAGTVTAVSFSSSGREFVTASTDGTARVWDTRTGRCLGALEGHRRPLTGAAFSPDGSRVVTTSVDGTACVWDTPPGDLLPRPPVAVLENSVGIQSVNEVTAAAWSPDGTRLVTGGRGRPARVWDTRTWRPVAVLGSAIHPPTGVSWSPRGDRILVTSRPDTSNDQYDVIVFLCDAGTGRAVWNSGGDSSKMYAATWTPDGRHFLVAGYDAVLRDAEAGKVVSPFPREGRNTMHDGTRYGRGPGVTVQMRKFTTKGETNWEESFPDEETAERVLFARGVDDHGHQRLYASCSPDGARVLVGSGDGCRIWSVRDNKQVCVLWDRRLAAFTDATWNSDGTRVATGHADGTTRVWDAASGKILTVMDRSPTANVTGAIWSPNGSWVFTAAWPREVRPSAPPPGRGTVWDARTGRLVSDFPAGAKERCWPDRTPVAGSEKPATVSPDGTRRVELAPGNKVRILHAATGAELLVLRDEIDGLAGAPRFASWSPDGNRIVVATGPTVTVLDATPLGH